MRQGVLYASGWLVVTVLATGTGIVAIGTVGNVLRGSGPLGQQFSAAAEQPRQPGEASTRELTLTHPAGELTVRCRNRIATLVAVQLAPEAVVGDSDYGPDEDVHVELDVAGTPVRLEAYCNIDVPRLVAE